jgi:hypothetical protein
MTRLPPVTRTAALRPIGQSALSLKTLRCIVAAVIENLKATSLLKRAMRI